MYKERKRDREEEGEGEVRKGDEDAEGEPEERRDRRDDGKIETYFTKCQIKNMTNSIQLYFIQIHRGRGRGMWNKEKRKNG